MPAYVVFGITSVSDPAGMAAYRAAAGPSLRAHGAKFLAGSTVAETLEGDPLSSCAIVEFVDLAAAEAWYRSEEYQSVAKLRHDASDGFALILQSRD